MKARPAVFLDRDGVINAYVCHPEFGTVDSPVHANEFQLLLGVAESIAELNALGLPVIVVSNQPGIAKRKLTRALLDSITQKMHAALAAGGARLDGVYYCLHHPDATLPEYRAVCECRKPKPGMLVGAARERNLDLSRSYLVGDGVTDVLAGMAAGARTLFLSSRKCYVCDELARHSARPDFIVGSLAEAVEVVRKLERNETHCLLPSGSGVNCGLNESETTYISQYIGEAVEILKRLDQQHIDRVVNLLVQLRQRGGRLLVIGVGGGAGHASHAVCDFRKIAQIEAYCPSDNTSELTAWVNDEGWDTSYANWLRGSRLNSNDMVFVFSVGGGDLERNVSANLVQALRYAQEVGATICGVVGRNGGYTAQVADACVLIPVVNPSTVTPHTESFQALAWHLLVSHPKLKAAEMKWESVQAQPAV